MEATIHKTTDYLFSDCFRVHMHLTKIFCGSGIRQHMFASLGQNPYLCCAVVTAAAVALRNIFWRVVFKTRKLSTFPSTVLRNARRGGGGIAQHILASCVQNSQNKHLSVNCVAQCSQRRRCHCARQSGKSCSKPSF